MPTTSIKITWALFQILLKEIAIFILMKVIFRFLRFAILLPGSCLLFIPGANAQTFKRTELPVSIVHPIDSLAAEHENTFHYPGLAVAIAYKGHQLWTKGYGYADLEHHVRIFDMMPVELYLTPFVAADSAPSKRLPRGHGLR